MFSITNNAQAAIQAIIFLLLGFTSYTYFFSKQPHARLFGLGLAFIALSFASWSMATLLWTNPLVEYKSLAYTLLIASILVFFGCSAYLAPFKYQKSIHIAVIGLAVAFGLYFFINPLLDGATIYSIRYYLSFQNQTTITLFSIALAISLILATFSVTPTQNKRFELNAKRVSLIILALTLAISFSSYSDTIRAINTIILLIDCVIIAVSHISLSSGNKA